MWRIANTAGRKTSKLLYRHPVVERLEDRITPGGGTWNGMGADNNWSTGGNWSSNAKPGTGDPVTFNTTSSKNSTANNVPGPWSVGAFTINGYTGVLTLKTNVTATAQSS